MDAFATCPGVSPTTPGIFIFTMSELIKFEELQRPDVFGALSQSIQQHVKQHGLTVEFRDKKGKATNYPMVEAWQYAGALLGLFPRLKNLESLSNESAGVFKYRAEIDIIQASTQQVICTGVAICSNAESSKRYFDEYAICSMAQTRATGKAFRLCLGWVMKAAGFEPTPAEDMDFQEEPDNNARKGYDPAVIREYLAFAVAAVKSAPDAVMVKNMAWAAKSLKEVPEFIDAVKSRYKELMPDG